VDVLEALTADPRSPLPAQSGRAGGSIAPPSPSPAPVSDWRELVHRLTVATVLLAGCPACPASPACMEALRVYT